MTFSDDFFPSLDDIEDHTFDDDCFPSLDEIEDPELRTKAIQAFKEALEDDPFFKALEQALEQNPNADIEALINELEATFPIPEDDDKPMPLIVPYAPSVLVVRRRSCGGHRSGHRTSGNGRGKGGGDGGSGDGGSDDGSDGDCGGNCQSVSIPLGRHIKEDPRQTSPGVGVIPSKKGTEVLKPCPITIMA